MVCRPKSEKKHQGQSKNFLMMELLFEIKSRTKLKGKIENEESKIYQNVNSSTNR